MGEHVMCSGNADRVRAKLIVEGANGPTTPLAEDIMVPRALRAPAVTTCTAPIELREAPLDLSLTVAPTQCTRFSHVSPQ